MRRLRHWLSGLLLATVLISVFSMTAYAEEDKTIRIGLYNKDGYHVIDDNNRHSGYDHEYLMEISKYTGWRYEFVEGTWQECITMLENGEIDLLGGVAKNEAWAYTMNYAAEPSAYSSNCLLVGKESVRYAYEDFAAFDQMRIGVLSNSTINDDLQKYSKEHQFTYTLYPYDTEAELVDALTQGEIDCAGLSDFRNLSHYKIIARMSDTPLYYVTSPQRADLKAELDDALQKIHEQNKYYEYHLYDKYFMFAHQIAFTREEQEYIKEHQQIEVALFRDIPMICTFNEFTGQYEGFIITILDKLSQKTGFQFTYVPLPENQMPWDYLHNHPNALLAPLFQNELIHYSEEMCFLDTIVPSQMVAVTQEAENFSYPNGLQELTLVIPEGMFGATQEIEELFPGCEILFCQGHQEGLDMVRHGEADLTLINEVLWTYLSQSPRYDVLDSTYLNHIVEDITIGIGTSSDTMLMSILNKAIQSFSRRDIQQIVMEYTSAHPYQLTLREKLYTNGQSILLLLLSVIAVIVLRIVHQRRKKSLNEETKKREIAEAKLKTAEEYQDKLFQQANFDSLTGLYNRKYFIEKCDELLLQNPDKTYVFYHINLSDFKMVNEIYGMQQGDLVLLKVAAYLKKICGKNGLYGRIYADQFAVCYCLTPLQLERLNRCQTMFRLDCNGQYITIQGKIGVYVDSEHINDTAQALTYAAVALQNHSEPAENHVYLYKSEYMEKLLQKQLITNEMEYALQDGQFQVYLQPQYDIQSGKLVSAEALTRWVHPKHGCISPSMFIPTLEASRFISQLDLYIFEEVCKLLAGWRQMGKFLPISINLSKIDLQSPVFLSKLGALLKKYDLPAEYLHLEVTESVYAENHEKMYSIIKGLRQAGFIIEMDDFGSGYSSLNMLKDIPVDVLKLDMKFFSDERNMNKGGSIVDAIVKMAHTLGIVVVAEGVETKREERFLQSIHCLIAQGYLYGKAMSVGEFEKLLTKSEIGDKMNVIPPAIDVTSDHLYWGLEQLHILLQHSGMILFEYDPALDYAVFTSNRQQEGELITIEMPQYMKKLPQHRLLHPDYHEVVRQMLSSVTADPTEIDVLADCYRTEQFGWFHVKAYHYSSGGVLNKVIGLIEQKEQYQNCSLSEECVNVSTGIQH